jgi:hypothetical protein
MMRWPGRALIALAFCAVVPVALASDAANGLFSHPVVLRGTLGDAQIQMRLQPKADPDEGIEGEYFAFGRGGRIALAGETEDDALLMEESENGVDVSGQWQGSQHGDTVTGTWTSGDGTVTKSFSLKAVEAIAMKPAH